LKAKHLNLNGNNFLLKKSLFLCLVLTIFFISLFSPVSSEVNNISLESTSGLNQTTDNLTLSYELTGADTEETTVINWWANGESITQLHMSFNQNISTTTAGAIKDYSGNGINGTLGGGVASQAPVWRDDCKFGGCYYFDGVDDYINISFEPDYWKMGGGDSITMSAWIEFDAITNEYG